MYNGAIRGWLPHLDPQRQAGGGLLFCELPLALRVLVKLVLTRPEGFYLSIVFYNAGLGIIKLSLLLQYYRIFASSMRKVTVIGMVIVGLWCGALTLTSIFSCTPVEGFWDKSISANCIPQLPQWYINAAGKPFSRPLKPMVLITDPSDQGTLLPTSSSLASLFPCYGSSIFLCPNVSLSSASSASVSCKCQST